MSNLTLFTVSILLLLFLKKEAVAGLEVEMVSVEARLKTFPGDGRKVNSLSPADFLPAEILT